jgi:hypothetical protein
MHFYLPLLVTVHSKCYFPSTSIKKVRPSTDISESIISVFLQQSDKHLRKMLYDTINIYYHHLYCKVIATVLLYIIVGKNNIPIHTIPEIRQ